MSLSTDLQRNTFFFKSFYRLLLLLSILSHDTFSSFAECTAPIFHPVILPAGSFTDAYTASVSADDGTFVQLQTTITNIGPGGPNGTIRLLAILPGGVSWKATNYYGRDKWHTEESPGSALVIGPCRLGCTNDSTRITMALKGGNVDIVSDVVPTPVKVPLIDVTVTSPSSEDSIGKFFEYSVLIHGAKANMTLTIPGSVPRTIKGCRLMLEHSRSVGTAPEVSRGIILFRGLKDGKSVMAQFRIPVKKNAPAAGWIWKEADAAPVAVNNVKITSVIDTVNGKPRETTFCFAPNNQWTIRAENKLFRYSFIDDLGPILGNLTKLLVGNPATYYYKSDLTWASDTTRAAYGVLEFFRVK
jgi:hypothetical protein